MLYNYTNLVNGSHFREKLYKGLKSLNLISSYNSWGISEIKLMFLLSNTIINKSIFLALLILIEKITLTNFSFVLSKKTIANFNVKKKLKVGAVFTIRGFEKEQFLRLFKSYSLHKINNSPVFYNKESKNFKISLSNHTISLGIQQILFLGGISLNNPDYALMSSLFENLSYGLHIYFYSMFRNFYLNRLIMSQYGITIL
jgi:ribosomal protein L5